MRISSALYRGPFLPGLVALVICSFEAYSFVHDSVPPVSYVVRVAEPVLSDVPEDSLAQPSEVPEQPVFDPRPASIPLTADMLAEAPFGMAEFSRPVASSFEPLSLGSRSIALARIESEPAPGVETSGAPISSGVGSSNPGIVAQIEDRGRPESFDPPVPDNISYRIRPGDLLDVFVWGQSDLSQKMRVARDGSIVVRLAGAVRVAGLTVNEASSLIRTRLSRYIIEPAVTVAIAEFGGKDVLMAGEVKKAGPIAIDRPTTLLDILIQAEWKAELADISNVRLVRGDSVYQYNIEAVLAGRQIDHNVLVEPGDLVIVPPREQKISLLGAFAKPGRYAFPLKRQVAIKDILLEASTWNLNADLTRAFVLHPDGNVDPVDLNALWFQGRNSENRILRHEDSLVIPEIAEIGVYLLGEVSKQGLYKARGKLTLLQAITEGVPSNFRSNLTEVKVVRGWPDHPRVFSVNVKRLLKGDLKHNMLLETGDVVYVPQGIISYTLDFWNQLLSPIAGTAESYENIMNVKEGEFDNN